MRKQDTEGERPQALAKHLQQEEPTFKELEELLFKFSLNLFQYLMGETGADALYIVIHPLFQYLMGETLGEIDQKLMEDRDKNRYQSKEMCKAISLRSYLIQNIEIIRNRVLKRLLKA